MPRETSRYRSSSKRRSLSSSSSSSHDRHKNKSKRRHRSRSRDSDTSRRRRRSRSSSYGRYKAKTKKRSASKASSKKSKRRSSRSSSREKYRSSKSHKKSVRRRSVTTESSSSGSSSKSEQSSSTLRRKFPLDDTNSKIEKAIKAAEAAGLTLTKLPTYEYKEVVVKEDMPSITDRNLLQELNNDSFVSKPFVSSRNKKFSENIVIDLDTQTIKMPEIEVKEEDTILKLDELPSDEELKEMWIKKLYAHRKKILENM